MGKYWQAYFHSFRLKKQFWEIFLIDVITFFFVLFSFSWWSSYFQNKMQFLMQGKSLEQMQQWLSQAAPEQLLPFFTEIKMALLWGGISLAVLMIASFLLYSLSTALIWNRLNGKKLILKDYWRWNLLNLVLIIMLVLAGLLFLLIKLMTMAGLKFLATISSAFYLAHQALMDGILIALNSLVSFILVLFFLVLIFLVYHFFVEKHQVWLSIGEAFGFWKLHWGKLWRMVLLMALTALVFTLVLLPVFSRVTAPFWNLAVGLLASLLFLAWARIYFLRTINVSSVS